MNFIIYFLVFHVIIDLKMLAKNYKTLIMQAYKQCL